MGHGIEGSRRGPEAAAATGIDGLHHAVGIEHRQLVAYLVAVVPLLQFVEVHAVLGSQRAHLVLGEPEVLPHAAWLHHGVFDEIVQGRLRLIFLDGQYARHVDAGKDARPVNPFEHTAQPVHIAVHGLCARLELAADGIPLVDDEDKLFAGLQIDPDEKVHEVVRFSEFHLRIGSSDVCPQRTVDLLHDVRIVEA